MGCICGQIGVLEVQLNRHSQHFNSSPGPGSRLRSSSSKVAQRGRENQSKSFKGEYRMSTAAVGGPSETVAPKIVTEAQLPTRPIVRIHLLGSSMRATSYLGDDVL